MKKLLGLIFSVLFITNANAAGDPLETCLNKISNNDTAWKSGISDIFGNSDLDDVNVEHAKAQIYLLLSQRFRDLCGTELVQIAKKSNDKTDLRGQIDFTHKDKKYGFDFSVDRIFDNLGIQTGILVINRRDLYPTKVLELSDIPKKQKFFNDECSDHTIWDNLDDDAAVNIAGQSVFTEYGGSNEEFFLDFAEGDNRRAFPGLVIKDKTGSTEEEIVSYMNIKTGVARAQQFAEKLKNTPCSRDNLSVYLVALNVQKAPVNTSDNRDISSTTTGSIAGAGLATGVIATTALVKTGAAATATAAALGTAASSVAWLPVAGWVVAGTLGITAATIALWPQKITDIKQVMILDGPYSL